MSEYIPFEDEWKQAMKRETKNTIIDIASDIGKKNASLEGERAMTEQNFTDWVESSVGRENKSCKEIEELKKQIKDEAQIFNDDNDKLLKQMGELKKEVAIGSRLFRSNNEIQRNFKSEIINIRMQRDYWKGKLREAYRKIGYSEETIRKEIQ